MDRKLIAVTISITAISSGSALSAERASNEEIALRASPSEDGVARLATDGAPALFVALFQPVQAHSTVSVPSLIVRTDFGAASVRSGDNSNSRLVTADRAIPEELEAGHAIATTGSPQPDNTQLSLFLSAVTTLRARLEGTAHRDGPFERNAIAKLSALEQTARRANQLRNGQFALEGSASANMHLLALSVAQVDAALDTLHSYESVRTDWSRLRDTDLMEVLKSTSDGVVHP